ncbi:MAG: SusC/RagA family TonB-linked outer membrane protein [Muribaculaceae bacterium]|nr:SusC/RagA family TonB-linked outer membrane protein [Muribaculaceae bacterium]
MLVKGTQKGVAADIDGQFTLSGVDKNATLVVSAVGYTSQEIPLKGRTDITVTLIEDSKVLDDVVVIGYGSLQKKQVTSAITSIKGEDLVAGVGGATVGTALQGKIAGLTIDGTNSPNSGVSLQLRGVGSINSTASPLVIIDGFTGGDLSLLANDDIESIDVLKDGSAGAIYGTRAANGVILVTTKKGRPGKVNITYTGEFTTEFERKRPEMLSAEEYLDIIKPAQQDFGGREDWYDALIVDHPFTQQHMLTAQGGTENLTVYSSLMFRDAQGIILGDERKDYSGRINATYKTWGGRVELGLRLQARENHVDGPTAGTGSLNTAMKMNPTSHIYSPTNPNELNVHEDNLVNDGGSPLADLYYTTYDSKTDYLVANATLKINIWDGLSLHGSANLDRQTNYNYSYQDEKHLSSWTNNYAGHASHSFSKSNKKNFDAYLSYIKELGANKEHRLDATLGWAYYTNDGSESFSANNSDFSINGIGPWDLGEGAVLKDERSNGRGMSSSKGVRTGLLSYFARANYSYDDKYMISASIRHEGSGKFGKNHRWGNFWAVSGGWRISRENFMENTRDWLSDLKIRVAYGVTGNNSIPNGITVHRLTAGSVWYNESTGTWLTTYGPANNVNDDLQWEEKKEFDVGVDFSFFNDRLWGKFDWYNRDIDHLIFSVSAPVPPYVNTSIYRNLGLMRNRGWEIEMGGIPIQNKDFSWTSTLNISHNHGKIVKLAVSDQELTFQDFGDGSGANVRLKEGSDIGKFFLYRYAGLDEDGKFLIQTADGEVVSRYDSKALVKENKYYTGNAYPAIIANWNNTFRYRNFDFSLSLRSWLNFDAISNYSWQMGISHSKDAYNIVKPLYEKNKDIQDTQFLTDRFLEDASFLKIESFSVGYSLNTSKWIKYIPKARLYLTLRDIYTFTKFSGMNPEIGINGLAPGFETRSGSSLYPQTLRCTAGVQLTF